MALKNVQIKIVGKSMVITIPDLDHDGGKSSSGKSTLVASTHGTFRVSEAEGRVPDKFKSLRLSLNLFKLEDKNG